MFCIIDKTKLPTDAEKIMQYIHWAGAFLAYYGGLAWMTMHTIISIILCKDPNKVKRVIGLETVTLY